MQEINAESIVSRLPRPLGRVGGIGFNRGEAGDQRGGNGFHDGPYSERYCKVSLTIRSGGET